MAFVIMTDSASDMPAEVKIRYGVHVIPTPVTIDGADYFDGDTIYPDEFYRIQSTGKEIKTYHINQYMFVQHFEPYARRGDEVLYICFSTGIAGTYNAAVLAREELQETWPGFKLTIIDSHSASVGMALMTERLLHMQSQGASAAVLRRAAAFYGSGHMEHIITVGTLDYLVKGGRISRISGVMGSALDIKPIIVINKEGALEAKEKIRGFKKAISRCIELTGERGVALDRQKIGVCTGLDRQLALEVAERLREKYHIKEVLITQVGCAIGAHTGPGILGITFLNAREPDFTEHEAEQ